MVVVSAQIASCVSTIRLMLDVVKTLPNSGRSNKRKFHQVLDKVLSRT